MANPDPLPVRIADWLANSGLRIFNLALRPLPYAKRVAVGGAVGRAVFTRVPVARRRITRNLDRILPDLAPERRTAIIRGVADNFGRVLVEEGMMREMCAEPGRFHVSGPGWPLFLEAAARGEAPIIVTAHFGNWEGVRTVARDAGFPLAAVYRPHNNPYYNADFVASIEVTSPINFPKGMEGTRALMRHVKAGGPSMVLIDQKQTGAPELPFLGHPAETALTPAKLARSNKRLLIPAISRRRSDGLSFDVIYGAPIPPGSAEEMMRGANDALSHWITETPEQWFWFHRRWR